jgi:hypothetical protein
VSGKSAINGGVDGSRACKDTIAIASRPAQNKLIPKISQHLCDLNDQKAKVPDQLGNSRLLLGLDNT